MPQCLASKSTTKCACPQIRDADPVRSRSPTVAALSNVLSGLSVNDSSPARFSGNHDRHQNNGHQEGDKSIVSESQKPRRGFSEAILRDFILESLSFKSMNYREQDIEQAHGSSFDWIFRDQPGDSHPSFSKWLSTASLGNIYWSRFEAALYGFFKSSR